MNDILQKYELSHQRQLSKLFSWLDENNISLQEFVKEDLELFFKTNRQARNTGKQIKIRLKQVLVGEGLPSEWVQTVLVPFPELFFSLDDVLELIDQYAQGIGSEKYKIEVAGFDSVKAAVILLWLGIPKKDCGYVLNDDVNKNQILFMKKSYFLPPNTLNFIEKYKKSEGYFSGIAPNLSFKIYKDTDYFLKTVKVASRDKIVSRLLEKVTDLDIDVNTIQKSGLFDRAYTTNDESLISKGLTSEYQEYKKKRAAIG